MTCFFSAAPGFLFNSRSAFALLLFVGTFTTCRPGDESRKTAPGLRVFDASQAESEWHLSLGELGADVPSDWSAYRTLVLEYRVSSPQRMYLKIHTVDPEKFSRVRLHIYPSVWVRSSIPIEVLSRAPETGMDMASVGNRSRIGYFLSLTGPFTSLNEVTGVSFLMEYPVGSPKLELRSVQLSMEDPGDAVLAEGPLVDEFGQFSLSDWNGKAKSLRDLESAWADEENSLARGDFNFCEYGGFQGTSARATGFFRVEKVDGRWWFVDPEGHLFLSAGSDCIRPHSETPLTGRQELFAALPPEERVKTRPGSTSFFTWNLIRRFGEAWQEKWVAWTFRRMDSWGLNTVANWSDPILWDAGRKPYVIPLRGWLTAVSYLGLPDVYSRDFVTQADEQARQQCAPRKEDPWLLGYFPANEPPFPQKELQTAQMILAGPDTSTKAELEEWLKAGDSEERRKEFIGQAFDRYVQVVSEAVRRHDPNHLNLGMRSGGTPTEAEILAARAFDVYSMNVYRNQVPPDRVRRISELTGKPILIGEFHFGTPGRGLAASLVQVRDEQERGAAYRYYVEQVFAMPEMIGTHWFQWVDQPCTGRFDGENYNIGLVDITDRPYPAMIEALRTTHSRLFGIHSGDLEPFAIEPVKN